MPVNLLRHWRSVWSDTDGQFGPTCVVTLVRNTHGYLSSKGVLEYNDIADRQKVLKLIAEAIEAIKEDNSHELYN
ncbi:MAG TPA: hypothetical protein VN631_03460, partial [Negativicutes bacterium]|nr:hypothetical protein [Negativicutes bacterium]